LHCHYLDVRRVGEIHFEILGYSEGIILGCHGLVMLDHTMSGGCSVAEKKAHDKRVSRSCPSQKDFMMIDFFNKIPI
jgi:hypothetical protein